MIQASKFHDIGDEMGDGNYFNGTIDDLGIWNRRSSSTKFKISN